MIYITLLSLNPPLEIKTVARLRTNVTVQGFEEISLSEKVQRGMEKRDNKTRDFIRHRLQIHVPPCCGDLPR
jgi:hypothetical protein